MLKSRQFFGRDFFLLMQSLRFFVLAAVAAAAQPAAALDLTILPQGGAVECDDILEIEVFEQYLKRFPAIRKPETGRILWH